jgi:hypothetical protein
MSESKQRDISVSICIYCGSKVDLTDEHVMPYALGGNLVLKKSSCRECAKETGKLEQRLLRGHWWPYRLCLGLPSRTSHKEIRDLPIKIICSDNTEIDGFLPVALQTIALILDFDPPSLLSNEIRDDIPNAARLFMTTLGQFPNSALVNGDKYILNMNEKINIPINYDASDLCRFLAKVAHGYAISRRGINACSEYFLCSIILGNTIGSQTYIGATSNSYIALEISKINGLHAIIDNENNGYLSVYIQLFRSSVYTSPIYEVIVGKI